MSSILTNVGAMQALQSINSTNRSLATTQNRISTGLRVANSKDNSSSWAIATAMRGDVSGFKAISENLALSTSAISVAVSYACPPGVAGGGCVRVDVYRNGELASPTLPVLFGPVLGITTQGVRATATAQASAANGTDCLKPWAVADKWLERDDPPWTQQST